MYRQILQTYERYYSNLPTRGCGVGGGGVKECLNGESFSEQMLVPNMSA